MHQDYLYEIGRHAQVDEGVVLGYRYPGDVHPTRIGDDAIIRSGVKIMAGVYIPSETVIGDMVFIGPGTTILNDKRPMR